MKRTSSILTVLLLLLAALLAIASCTPANQGGGETQPPVTTEPIDPVDPDNGAEPQIGKTTIEFSVFSNGPALVTYDLDGKRVKEIFEKGSMTYAYNEAGVLSKITLESDGEELSFICQYGDNGLPTKATCSAEDDEEIDEIELVFTYGENGKLTSIAYQMEDTVLYEISYGENGMVEQVTTAGGSATMTPTYNEDSYMIKASVKMQEMLLGEYVYTYSDTKQLVEIVMNAASEDSEELELQEKTVINHSADSHLAVVYFPDEDGELVKASESLYDIDWKLREKSYYDDGVVTDKTLYFKDSDGNEVTEYYALNEDSELVVFEKMIECLDEDGNLVWSERWILSEDGSLYLECKITNTDATAESLYYDAEGTLTNKIVETLDEDGNSIEQVYHIKRESDELYLASYSRYNSQNELLEEYNYNEDGEVEGKILRRDREEGGYYLDYYELNEDGELVLSFSETFDEGGMPNPDQGGNEDDSDVESEIIQNAGANTEGGWGPIQK